MANSINATSTGNGGIITTGDDSGVLNIQTNETTAISIDASQNATFTNGVNLPNTFGFKNRIINGGMVIDQRNAGASVTPASDTFLVDRFDFFMSQASKFSVQQNQGSVTPPTGFSNYLGFTVVSAVTVGGSDYFGFEQKIEGFNTSDFNWGTASAVSVTLSFWVRSSLTGTFGGVVKNGSNNYSYAYTYTISAANTWEQKTVTIPGPTAGTWSTTNTTSLRVQFGLGVGSTFSKAAGSWAANDAISATGATSVVGTNGATWYITGVQLEKGTQATSFDFRSIGTELALCQRYYETISGYNSCYSNATNGLSCGVYFKVTKRASPTTAFASTYAVVNWNSPAIGASTTEYVEVTQALASSVGFARIGFSLTISAEL